MQAISSPWSEDSVAAPVVIAIDDASISELGRWPWSRQVHTDVLNKLIESDASVVAYNIAFIDADESKGSVDAALQQAFIEGRTVQPLITTITGKELYPFQDVNFKGMSLGHVHLDVDIDGILRRVFLAAGIGSPKWEVMGLAANNINPNTKTVSGIGLHSALSEMEFVGRWNRDYEVLLNFDNAQNTSSMFSFVDVLQGKVSPERFKGKAVFVGITAAGFEQKFPVRSNGNLVLLSGTEVQAQIYQNIQNHALVVPAPAWLSHFVSVIFCVLLVWLLWINDWKQKTMRGLGFVVIAVMVVFPVLSVYLGYWVYMTPGIILALVLCLLYGVLYIQNLNKRAHLDKLTGLANRRLFDETTEYTWNLAMRKNMSITLVMIDVDYFKEFNDYFGHSRGDWALARLSKVFKRHGKRQSDLVARYGGEEFVMLLPDTKISYAEELAIKLLKDVTSLAIPHPKSGTSEYLSVSIGVAKWTPKFGDNFNDLLGRADKALYMAKSKGRNRMEVCQEYRQ